jgi:hypothetical protein
LQPDPQKDLDHCNQVLSSSGKKSGDLPAKFQRRWSPAARGNRPGRIRGLARSLLGVMRRSGSTGGGGTTMTRGGGDGAQLRRRCSGEGVHRRRSRGWGEARGEQGGSIEHLGEGWGGRKGRSPRQTEAAAERSTATAMLRRSASAKVLCTSIDEPWVMHCCIQLRLTATEKG